MLDERIRRRLQSLNRAPLPTAQGSAQHVNRSPLSPSEVKPIPGMLRRGTVVANELGQHLRIRLPVDEIWPGGERLVARRHAQLATLQKESPAEDENELDQLVAAFPGNVLLMDLETCGLAGSALFLVGVLRNVDDRPTVELLLARNYAEERAVLTSFWQIACRLRVLVTFNGKSFDWPMVLDRSARHLLFRRASPPELLHVDLLHHSRRRWRQQLPDCRLQTLEQHICGRGRMGDIPGRQIPAAYQAFVRTGIEREMDAILLHNAIDLVTLLDLSMRLAGP